MDLIIMIMLIILKDNNYKVLIKRQQCYKKNLKEKCLNFINLFLCYYRVRLKKKNFFVIWMIDQLYFFIMQFLFTFIFYLIKMEK